MPLTFPAHQAAVLPLKMRRPAWFDATALVVGSASPDLMYGLWNPPWLSSHSIPGLIIWCVPFTVAYAIVLRRWAADGLFGSLPDAGPLRLHSYRVLGERTPPLGITVSSALLGAGSHVFIDSFTHGGRWGTVVLGLNGWVETPFGTHTGAKLMQYLGHTVGSAIGIALFVVIAGGKLSDWYGDDVVAEARARPVEPGSRVRTAAVVSAAVAISFVWAQRPEIGQIFANGAFLALGLLAAGLINQVIATRRHHPTTTPSAHSTTPGGCPQL